MFSNLGPWGMAVFWLVITAICVWRGWKWPGILSAAIFFTALGTTVVGERLLTFGYAVPPAIGQLISAIFRAITGG